MVAEKFEMLTEDDKNHFTEYDILCALRTYHNADEQAYRRRIDFISAKTGITLVPNKRNGRKQDQHLKIARFTRDLNYDNPNGWINKEGAPTKQSIVQKWRLRLLGTNVIPVFAEIKSILRRYACSSAL
jgi:hypothetical protein